MTVEQALPVDALRPRWSSATALVYMGGFVVLIATSALLGILGDDHGDWALVGWSALATLAAGVLAHALERGERPVGAGVLATLGVVFFAILVGSLESAIGILDVDIGDYQPASLLLEALTIGLAFLALQRFRAPLLVLPIALTLWVAIADLGSLGSWDSAGELLSIIVGLVLVAAGIAVDRAGRQPYGFWLHVVGGLAFGGGILALVEGDLGWAFVGLVALAYVAAAYVLGRSSYAVLGTIGILATTTYFTLDGFSPLLGLVPFGIAPAEAGLDPWQVALSFVAAGLVIGLLGLLEDRVAALRRR